jgi:predicted DNA-binding protein YlxM (UPF0122 family)
MTLPIATETIVELYLDQMMTEQQIANRLGCSQQTVGYRLRKAGVSLKRTNKLHMYRTLKPHLPVLRAMTKEMRKRRREIAEFVVDPRNPDKERKKQAEALVILNREIKAMEIVISK